MPVAGVDGVGGSAPPPRPVEENPTQENPADEPAPDAVAAEGGGADGMGEHLNVIA